MFERFSKRTLQNWDEYLCWGTLRCRLIIPMDDRPVNGYIKLRWISRICRWFFYEIWVEEGMDEGFVLQIVQFVGGVKNSCSWARKFILRMTWTYFLDFKFFGVLLSSSTLDRFEVNEKFGCLVKKGSGDHLELVAKNWSKKVVWGC